jgi:hypothetical protein
MIKPWKMIVVTVLVGAAAFFVGPILWPMNAAAPMPPPSLLPAYIGVAAIEALAFGFAVSFAIFGWPAIRNLDLGGTWLNKLLFVTLCWFIGNWWIHDNLHMNVGFDMNRLFLIEYVFHVSMLACAITLTVSFIRLLNRIGAGSAA